MVIGTLMAFGKSPKQLSWLGGKEAEVFGQMYGGDFKVKNGCLWNEFGGGALEDHQPRI